MWPARPPGSAPALKDPSSFRWAPSTVMAPPTRPAGGAPTRRKRPKSETVSEIAEQPESKASGWIPLNQPLSLLSRRQRAKCHANSSGSLMKRVGPIAQRLAAICFFSPLRLARRLKQMPRLISASPLAQRLSNKQARYFRWPPVCFPCDGEVYVCV